MATSAPVPSVPVASGDAAKKAPRKRKRLVSAEVAKSRVKTAPLTEEEKLLRKYMRHERLVEEAKKAGKPLPEFTLKPEERERFTRYVQSNNEEQLKAARRRVTQYNLNSARTRAKKPLQEIRHFQRETGGLNPALPYQHYVRRLFKENIYETCPTVAQKADDVHWAKSAFTTLQCYNENVAVRIIETANSLRAPKAGKKDDNHLVTENQVNQAILILGYETAEEQRARLEKEAKEKPQAPVAAAAVPSAAASAAAVVEAKDLVKVAKPKPAKTAPVRPVLSKTAKAIHAMKTVITGAPAALPAVPAAQAAVAVAAPVTAAPKKPRGGGKKKAAAPAGSALPASLPQLVAVSA